MRFCDAANTFVLQTDCSLLKACRLSPSFPAAHHCYFTAAPPACLEVAWKRSLKLSPKNTRRAKWKEKKKKNDTLFCAIHRRPRRAICKHKPTLRRLLYLISHLSARNTIIVLSPMVAQRSTIYFQSEYAEIPR